MEEKIFEGMAYLVSYPEGFREDEKYPLLIFLHGRGARSASTEKLHQYTCLSHLRKRQNERGYILLAPHCKSGNWNEWMGTLIRLVEMFRELPFVDDTRVCLTGNSMGGYGTWMLATLRPHWFAAAMPVCGGGIGGLAGELGDLPIRAFHGLCDETVDPVESLQMAKAVNKAGGYAELILFPGLAHNCWDAAYTDEGNYDWLFSFTNRRGEDSGDQISGV
ncbi:MAG: prolyl oligopeptidase family serine peptidase [Oscillospiraceae bacterium]|nr:prolyl oligopeptidase family serine peptidase [Oscillospiraceae bacterium]